MGNCCECTTREKSPKLAPRVAPINRGPPPRVPPQNTRSIPVQDVKELAENIADHVANPEKCTEHKSTQIWNKHALTEDIQKFRLGQEETEMSLGTGFRQHNWGTNTSLRIKMGSRSNQDLQKFLLPALKKIDENWEEAEEGRFVLNKDDK